MAADPRAITSEAIAPPNPLQAEVTIEKQPPAIDSNTIRDLATQIIDRIQVMTKGNETQTMITLRHPPVLEGATITLTSSDHAKQEFNISFANLSPEAKLLLDNKLRDDPLSAALERRGITVHILTTSTQPEQALIHTYSDQHERQEQGQQRQEQGQQRQRQHKQPFQFSRDEDEL